MKNVEMTGNVAIPNRQEKVGLNVYRKKS